MDYRRASLPGRGLSARARNPGHGDPVSLYKIGPIQAVPDMLPLRKAGSRRSTAWQARSAGKILHLVMYRINPICINDLGLMLSASRCPAQDNELQKACVVEKRRAIVSFLLQRTGFTRSEAASGSVCFHRLGLEARTESKANRQEIKACAGLNSCVIV